MKNDAKRRGFSLMELLAVLGIVTALIAVSVPIIGKAYALGHRVVAANHVRQICHSCAAVVAQGEGAALAQAKSVQQWAAALAKLDGPGDARLYYISDDPAHMGIELPEEILVTGANGRVNEAFMKTQLSYAARLGPLPMDADSAVPLIWTRGLGPDGTWSEDSPYGGKGGHVGFLDGHVLWFSSLSESPAGKKILAGLKGRL